MDALLHIVSKPDNLPILIMIPVMVVLTVLWWRLARHNDQLLDEGGEPAVLEDMQGPTPEHPELEQLRPDGVSRVHTWPYLVRVELLALLVVMLLLTIWSITVDAPLEQMADPTRTPNPSKAPWYFLGLQEMLVYFDPWIAGVALPVLIIFGLCAIPYVDVNAKGNGYHCWRDRRFAIASFLFGFLILWLLLIVIGVFCRGPGWHWFWPWETWDAQTVREAPTVDWPQLFGIDSAVGASVFGGLTVASYYGLAVVYWVWRRSTRTLQRLGAARYSIVAFLFLTMLALPIKIALRLALSVKYVWTTPWFNI